MTEQEEIVLESDSEDSQAHTSKGSMAPGVKDTDINYSNMKNIPSDVRKKIIQDLHNGIEYKHFELKSDGGLKRKKPPTKIQKIVDNSKNARSVPDPNKTYLSDIGQLWEHVIELTKANVKLTEKNKKRKKENIRAKQQMDDIIYFFDNDEDEPVNEEEPVRPTTISENKPRPKTLRERLRYI